MPLSQSLRDDEDAASSSNKVHNCYCGRGEDYDDMISCDNKE